MHTEAKTITECLFVLIYFLVVKQRPLFGKLEKTKELLVTIF